MRASLYPLWLSFNQQMWPNLGLVTKQFLPGGKWLDSQRLPHTDIDWQHGLRKNESTGVYEVPQCYASLLSLTTKFNESGTGIYLEKETGWSLLKTLPMNERAQGNINPHVENHLHKHLNLREEIPDPHPWSLDYTLDNAWIKSVGHSHARMCSARSPLTRPFSPLTPTS